jgi:ectoine hydroxylase-related dioxygenase (phytanoyl-CoA dioxygenase family)
LIDQDSDELTVSNSLLDNPELLRQRLQQDGYLYLRGIVDRQAVMALRNDILQIFGEHGWLMADSPREQGMTDAVPAIEGEDAFFAVYDEVQKLESLHSLAHNPQILTVLQGVIGSSVFPHPLGIARMGFPRNEECTTPPHQDYPNNQGTTQLYACWIPLGDCPRQLGGLSMLESSPSLGLLPLEFSLGAGARQAVLPEQAQQMRWLTTDYECGDILIFGSLAVHRSLPNLSGDRFRLSVDFRYQEEGQALTPTVLKPHFGRLSWEQVYADWQSDRLQYYWNDKEYEITEWNTNLHELPPQHLAEAVRLARAYNRRRQQMAED